MASSTDGTTDLVNNSLKILNPVGQLKEKDSLIEMLYTYEKIASLTKKELIICPTDYPYLYNQNENTR